MLANVLKSDRAVQVSIKIIEIFVKLREMLNNQKELEIKVEKIKREVEKHDSNIAIIFKYLDELFVQKSRPRRAIGFKAEKE